MVPRDKEMLDSYHLSVEDAQRARDWWNKLPSDWKGSVSIWVLLAVFAKHVQDITGRE